MTTNVSAYANTFVSEERLRLVEKSKSIFELVKYMKVLQFIYLRVWWSSWILELQVSVILTVVKK
jgi:hypothetical protein